LWKSCGKDGGKIYKESGILQKILSDGFQETSFVDEQPLKARLAVYTGQVATPQITDLTANSPVELMDLLSAKTYQVVQEKEGAIPFTAIKEVVENLLHANFQGVVVSVMEEGQVVRVTDNGPGISDKKKAFLPGFTTATPKMRQVIRGVGSGLPLVKDLLESLGGKIFLDDNLKRGTVVTLFAPKKPAIPAKKESTSQLTLRQKKLIMLLAEVGPAGPSRLAHELQVSLSTAYRDLRVLEESYLVNVDDEGKRSLSEKGLEVLDLIARSPELD
jgi:DNA-binding transcriptional ArsR family regulator